MLDTFVVGLERVGHANARLRAWAMVSTELGTIMRDKRPGTEANSAAN